MYCYITKPRQFADFAVQLERGHIRVNVGRQRRVRVCEQRLRASLVHTGTNAERLERFPEAVEMNDAALPVALEDSGRLEIFVQRVFLRKRAIKQLTVWQCVSRDCTSNFRDQLRLEGQRQLCAALRPLCIEVQIGHDQLFDGAFAQAGVEQKQVSSLSSDVLSGRVKPTTKQVKSLAASALGQDEATGKRKTK